MKVKKCGELQYRVILSGVAHPKDSHNVEFDLQRFKSGYHIIFPSYSNPATSIDMTVEQEELSLVPLFTVVGWSIKAIRDYYSERLHLEMEETGEPLSL